MWFFLALGSSIFAALTSVLAKIGMAALAASVACVVTADGDAPRRPMVLMVMFDGMRADAVETAGDFIGHCV